ncbi:TPA: hypothetical protein ACGW5B_001813 [Bacillus paranthracis]|uniref:hypothetical protein n=1 Tax=Bacillus TaxID=1386 RepID=UPI0005CE989C|nr:MULTISPECIES: hypothetical protein [Bacillus]MCW4577042.1 hypothetical protein [Bacillus pacificus]MDA1585221.1 hypothetical protein [Bacillus cereus group sp. TH230-1LC]MBG9908446.1 hypothetical protein [Bacillus paranthracis]QCU10311.1 hypothetical protein BCPR1_11295 [Bacillus paranthracis]TBL10799.1 hypothetical protein EYB35_13865 [Bacillus paranthracis]
MDMFQYLEEMQEDIFLLSVERIELKYFEICSMLASAEYAERIKAIDLESYKEGIRGGLDAAVEMTTDEEAKAIYFEYDLDNEWNSQFYICEEYAALEEEDDDWASEWIYDVEGPKCIELADVYAENGFDTNEKAMGITLYLIARTVCSFISACSVVQSSIPICIGFHDQDPIIRTGRDS